MTDREMLELAAKAAGIRAFWKLGMHQGAPREGLFCLETGHALKWNPLADDGDAFRLAVKLGIEIRPERKSVTAAASGAWEEEPHGNDPYAATRRAITRAAAELGMRMQNV